MTGTEMLKAEIEKLGDTHNQIAEALMEEFKDPSNGLEKAWEAKGLTMHKLMEMLTPFARTKLSGKSGPVDGDTVMGWVNHLIIDGDVPETKKEARENLEKEDEDDADQPKKEIKAAPAKKSEAKPKPAKKEKPASPYQQLSLFDLSGGSSNGN